MFFADFDFFEFLLFFFARCTQFCNGAMCAMAMCNGNNNNNNNNIFLARLQSISCLLIGVLVCLLILKYLLGI
jgi:hypothetical protein